MYVVEGPLDSLFLDNCIAAGGADLTLPADNKDVVIGSDDGSGGLTDYIIADGSTGETKLFYYGSQKLKTISTGVQTTGTINVNGAYTLPTADGSNTQVLMTDGAGTVSFADSGGGTGTDNHATKIFNFLDTEPRTLPPKFSANVLASDLLIFLKLPVNITLVLLNFPSLFFLKLLFLNRYTLFHQVA